MYLTLALEGRKLRYDERAPRGNGERMKFSDFRFPFISYPLPLRVLPLSQGEKVGDGVFLCPSKIGGEEGLQKND